MEKLGEKVNATRQTAARVIHKLQERGIIRQYATVVDPTMYQTFFIEFKTNPREPQIAESLAHLSNMTTLDGIIGEFSLFAKIVAKDQVEFAATLSQIDKFMAQSRFQYYRVINTITCFKDCGEIISIPSESGGGPKRTPSETDRRILEKIRYTPQRIRVSELALDPEVHLSQPVLSKKLEKFLEEGSVRKYTICVDPAFLHLQTKFILRVKPLYLDRYNDVANQMATSFPEIIDLYRTGENFGLLAIVRTPDIVAYNAFLRKLYETIDVEDTYTVLVIEERMPAILPIS
jgi:DNA-binding Lrp family transcriptional regulator